MINEPITSVRIEQASPTAFMANYRMILNSPLTRRQISNWLDTAAIPNWIVKGVDS